MFVIVSFQFDSAQFKLQKPETSVGGSRVELETRTEEVRRKPTVAVESQAFSTMKDFSQILKVAWVSVQRLVPQ